MPMLDYRGGSLRIDHIDFGRGLSLTRDTNKTGLELRGGAVNILTGGLTLTAGDLTVTAGDFTLTAGALNGFRRPLIIITGSTLSPTIAQSGTIWVSTRSSESFTVTLPDATTMGLTYTFWCGHADGQIIINAVGAETMWGLADDSGASINNGIFTNTGGTNILGDMITLVADGVSAWFAVSQAGIWAAT